MNYLIAGGTGFIGSYLKKYLETNGHKVLVVSRGGADVPWTRERLTEALENTDVLINLAGRNINCRHTRSNKEEIRSSRIESTRMLGEALAACGKKPALWINASASALYKASANKPSTEQDYLVDSSFLSETVQAWEKEFFRFQDAGVRQVAMRTTVVLGRGGGAFEPLYWLVRTGLGGKVGSGRQFFSWIHLEDYCRAITFISENKNINGVVNMSAPGVLTQSQFMQIFRRMCGMPVGLPAPALLVKVAATVIGTEASLLLDSVNVYPEVFIKNGFTFLYPEAGEAITALLKNKI